MKISIETIVEKRIKPKNLTIAILILANQNYRYCRSHFKPALNIVAKENLDQSKKIEIFNKKTLIKAALNIQNIIKIQILKTKKDKRDIVFKKILSYLEPINPNLDLKQIYDDANDSDLIFNFLIQRLSFRKTKLFKISWNKFNTKKIKKKSKLGASILKKASFGTDLEFYFNYFKKINPNLEKVLKYFEPNPIKRLRHSNLKINIVTKLWRYDSKAMAKFLDSDNAKVVKALLKKDLITPKKASLLLL